MPTPASPKTKDETLSPEQLSRFKGILLEGYPYIHLEANCKLGNEIHRFEHKEAEALRAAYREREGIKVLKFVPASGAASRMFKDLFQHLESGNENEKSALFFKELNRFAFAPLLYDVAGLSSKKALLNEAAKKDILKALLHRNGLNYGSLPKGLIGFHRYPDGSIRTAFEEHYHEALQYACKNGTARIHFTIPEQSREEVEVHLMELKQKMGERHEVDFEIEWSVQKPHTDTPAIYADSGDWVLEADDTILRRPAGHGALLANLDDIDADIIYVKNIDNVVPDHLKGPGKAYKELLGGVLLHVQSRLFSFLEDLEQGQLDVEGCVDFCRKWFCVDWTGMDTAALKAQLNRPLRVCGMVKNEGEPGGGPFVVRDPDGRLSLQIVEKAQVNIEDPQQRKILEGASHFNPVDLVLATKDYRGKAFSLEDFRREDTGMLVHKTHKGKDITGLELPGLWNGSMHYWNTIFVEVPIETFNPVKTVFDLLRPAHQGRSKT